MNILMFTNTYKPHIGGVANSVYSFKKELKKRGHNLMVVAPHFENEKREKDVLRVKAIRNFNGTDFSVSLPSPIISSHKLDKFKPHIIHSHHPFLLGSSALRIASFYNIPIVFTHHTLYERYTHYIPFESDNLKDLAVHMSVEYCNLCNTVIAPSLSIKELLKERGVDTEIEVIPTGIDKTLYNRTQRDSEFEASLKIPQDSFVLGHVSRLAKEKNQHFLCDVVASFLKKSSNALFVIAGEGDTKEELEGIFQKEGVSKQVIFVGSLKGAELVKLYKRFDLFVFSSTSETQGMVIAEALLSSTPVVALKASGVTEMIEDGENGYLLEDENTKSFVDTIDRFYKMDKNELDKFKKRAVKSASKYTLKNCTNNLENLYKKLIKNRSGFKNKNIDIFKGTLRLLDTEYRLWKGRAEAFKDSLT